MKVNKILAIYNIARIVNRKNLPIIKYAIGRHLSGETLLKNPKGTPSTFVRTMRYIKNLDEDTLDISKTIMKTTKNFSTKDKKVTNEYFNSDMFRFWNKDTKKLENKTNGNYVRYENGKRTKTLSKVQTTEAEIDKRDFSEIHKPKYRRKISYPDLTYAALGYARQSSGFAKLSLAEVESDKFYTQKFKKEKQSKYSFLETLLSNLQNK